MKKRVLAAALLVTLSLVGCESKPQPPPEPSPSFSPLPSPSPMATPAPTPTPTWEPSPEDYPELLYHTTTSFDPETNLQRTTLDPQGLDLSVFFEIPVFQEDGEGYQKINRFFETLRDDFFSPESDNLTTAWMLRVDCAPMQSTFHYEHNAIIWTKTKSLLSVSIAGYWWMGGVNGTWSDSYTFDPRTGEILLLSALIQESEEDALAILWTAMENSEIIDTEDTIFIEPLRQRTLDEFEFYVVDDAVYIAFDRYEAAPGVAGSFDIPLSVTLKQEWRCN